MAENETKENENCYCMYVFYKTFEILKEYIVTEIN